MLGGGEHETVRSAAKRFVLRVAGSAAATFPLPAEGRTAFSVLTTKGVVRAEAAEGDLGGGKHALSPLFTVLREATEVQKP